MPLFSVIIPVHNRLSLLREAVDSVLDQSCKDFELIVIDDGSSDGAPIIPEEYGDRLMFVRQEHRGVSAARNHGIRLSTSPWIAFLDSDDRWLPRKLERQHRYIRERPEVRMHQTGERWIRNGRRVNPGNRHLKREGDIFIDSLGLCLISPSAVVIRRDLFERHGTFDERLPACEDYDLWLRMAKDEWVGLVPEELVVRRGGHPDQLSARYPGMDRFRVYSILGLLERHGLSLSPEHRNAAIDTARTKTRILLEGAKKRKKYDVAEKLARVIEMMDEYRIAQEECGFLLNDDEFNA
ncbi:MAG: glycosyltransferase [Spirochaetes bacterium]|nr:glycosyltransferase [Spirochaetota bacterium]